MADTVSNTGSTQQEGLPFFVTKSFEGGPDVIRSSRVLQHGIDNAPGNIRQWDTTSRIFRDGFHAIPYASKRAHMEGATMQYLHQNYDLAKVAKIGFEVTFCKIEEQRAIRLTDTTKVDSIEAKLPMFDVIDADPFC